MAERLFAGPHDRRIKRVLCVAAHPDDVEYYCGGSVLLMTARKVEVAITVVTSGDKGSRLAGITSEALARQREAEQEAAAARLGALGVEFLRHLDAEVEPGLPLRRELTGSIRRARPDVILTFDPSPQYRFHPDHRAVGRAALDAAWPCARDPLTFPEQGPPWEATEAWCFGGDDHDLEVDVESVIDAKIDARLEHRSQTRSPLALRNRWRRTARWERFKRVDLR